MFEVHRMWPLKGLHALLLVCVLRGDCLAQTRAEEDARLPKGFEMLRAVRVPMRDGVRLNATVFVPRNRTGPLPVILTLSPYLAADDNYNEAVYFARSGYAYVALDSRGRGDSEGEFAPFETDAADAYDAVEFLSRQTWSNGRIGMWGRSYNGFATWAALKSLPPHLRSVFAAASSFPGYDFPMFRGNVRNLSSLRWLGVVSGRTANWPMYDNDPYWRDSFEAMYAAGLPYAKYDSVMGVTHSFWQKWLAHPHPDAYWDSLTPTSAEYARIDIPILTIAGHYPLDGNAAGALHYYQQHMRFGRPEATAKHYLVKGPWSHAGTTVDTVAYDMRRLAREWFDWTLADRPRPALLENRVSWLSGPGVARWQHAPSLGAMVAKPVTLLLSPSDASVGDARRPGGLVESGEVAPAALRFVNNPFERGSAVTQQSSTSSALLFETTPFAHAIELVGEVPVTLWLSMDVTDTDIGVELSEVRQNGSTIWRSLDWLRARYRRSLRTPEPVIPGRVEEYRLTIPLLARTVQAGSRLRLRVGAPVFGNQLNYNGGGNVAFESAKDGRVATVNLYLGAGRPSRVELPITALR